MSVASAFRTRKILENDSFVVLDCPCFNTNPLRNSMFFPLEAKNLRMRTARGLRSREKPGLACSRSPRGSARTFGEDRARTRRECARDGRGRFSRGRTRENRARTPVRAGKRARIPFTRREKRARNARTARTRGAKSARSFSARGRGRTLRELTRAADYPGESRQPGPARAHHARERARTARGWRDPKSLVNRARGNHARGGDDSLFARVDRPSARTAREAREAQLRSVDLLASISGLGLGKLGRLHGVPGRPACQARWHAGIRACWHAVGLAGWDMLSKRVSTFGFWACSVACRSPKA
jgi:hypothetical protein